ncbi:MAG: IS200/IS605 family transposase [Pyrinomonadaceae bacterium]
MANTYTQIYVQIVFAVRERDGLIAPEWKEELFKYIAGIIKNRGQKLIAIGGVADHIHILIAASPDIALSDLVREIKTASGKWINGRRLVRGKFYWQEGFGAFSYSKSQLDDVAKYVLNREIRHREQSFKHEYIGMLRKFDVDYDERFVFEFFE